MGAERFATGRTIMQPLSPLILARDEAPNVELLRRNGWCVNAISGTYCVAWRGRDEVIFEWSPEGWRRIGGRGPADDL
jgi:hypothetical protein